MARFGIASTKPWSTQLDLFQDTTPLTPEPVVVSKSPESPRYRVPLRVPTQPVTDLVRPGTVVRADDDTRRFIVVWLRHFEDGYNFGMVSEADFLARPTIRSLKSEYYFAYIIAVGGRLVYAFDVEGDEREKFICGFNADAAELLRVAA